jgi:hypothetical protein
VVTLFDVHIMMTVHAALLATTCLLASTNVEPCGVRQTIVKPLGLVTAPNKHGMPPGAMSKALNVCMREPNVLSPMPDVRTYRNDVMSTGATIRRLHAGASSVLAIGDNSGTTLVRWVTSANSTIVSAPPATSTTTFSAGKTHVAVMRDRWLLTNDTLEPWVLDLEGDTTSRRAGLPPPQLTPSQLTATNAQALPTASTVAYRAILRRVHADGYETISAPSQPIYITNSIGSTRNPILLVKLPGSASGTTAIAGDVVELYRSNAVTAGSDPGDTLRLAVAYTLVAGDISSRSATVTDNATEASLAVELYSNPGQEGPKKVKMPPPMAADVAVFKGHTFYNATRLRSYLKLKIPGPTGVLSSAVQRATGIGDRTFTGDIANGSFDILNVSDTTGLVVGQRLTVSGSAMSGSIINTIVGTTITASVASSITSVGLSITSSDRIEINGNVARFSTLFEPNSESNEFAARFIYEGAVSHVFTATQTWTITFPSSFIVENTYVGSSEVTLAATNGQNYYPTLPAIGATPLSGTSDPRLNRYGWSLDQQPEAVAPLDFDFVGSSTLYRMIPTRDALYMFCSDGLYRLSGDAGEWTLDPVDPTLVLTARNAVDVLSDTIWAYTNRGLVAITGDAVNEVSTGRISDPFTLPVPVYADTWDTYLTCDERHREVWLTFRDGGNSVSYVFTTLGNAFTTVDDDEWSAMTYSRALQSLVIGVAGGNPDVIWFEADASAQRMPGADVRFQPLTMGDPFTLKEFVDVDYLFEGAATAITLVPSFSDTNYTAVTVPANSIESHGVVPVPRNAPAQGRKIAPGFTISSGGVAQRWSLRGVGVTWRLASETSDR